MSALSVSNYGLTLDGNVEKGVYRLKNKGVEESKELYIKIQNLIKEAVNGDSSTLKQKIQSGLENRTFKRIKINASVMEFVEEGGRSVRVSLNDQKNSLSKLFADKVRNLKLTLHTIDTVVNQVVEETKFKKVLYLTSSGGGGHISAKDAVRDKRLSKLKTNVQKALIRAHGVKKGKEMYHYHFPNSRAFIEYALAKGLMEEKDVLVDYIGWMGRRGAEWWDETQKKGNVETLEFLARNQRLSSVLFAPIIFFHTLFTLISYKPEKIVSTQALCSDAIVSAIAVYNALFKPKNDLKLKLYMTDMPTEFSDHFFGPIRSMLSSQKNLLKLYTPKSNADFDWKSKAGLREGQYKELSNFELPIRPAFIEAVNKFQHTPFNPEKLQIKISCREERKILESIIYKDCQNPKEESVEYIDYKLGASDEAHCIMLGSQPTKNAILDYIKQYVQKAEAMGDKPLHLFLFTGKFEKDKKTTCFYKELASAILMAKQLDLLPSNLKIVPLSYQDADQIVSFFARCHSITRSGGATCMELMVMEDVTKVIASSGLGYIKPRRYVHSQIVKGRDAIDSIPLWERGNYYYMKDYCRAKIVTPKNILKVLGPKSASLSDEQIAFSSLVATADIIVAPPSLSSVVPTDVSKTDVLATVHIKKKKKYFSQSVLKKISGIHSQL